VFVKHGLSPVTLEEIGITQEVYEAAQARINGVGSRDVCPIGSWYNYLGDLNASGTATTFDLINYDQWKDGNYTPDPDRLENFGIISYWYEGTDIPPTDRDREILRQMILGICDIQ